MEEKRAKSGRSSKTKITPPKKKQPEALSRDEVRSINKKKVKRRRKVRRLVSLLALAVIIISVGVVLVLSVFFKINTISIKGDRVYSDQEIISKSGLAIGDNLFRVNEEKLGESLSKSLPYIHTITLERDLPDTLIVTVKATREVAAFQYGAGFILVNADGKVLDRDATMLRDNVAVVTGAALKGAPEGERIIVGSEEQTNDFVAVLKGITESGIKNITEIIITKNGEYELKYDERITIKIGSVDNVVVKLKRAVAALAKEDEINIYSEGVLDLKTEPYAYFDPGEDEPVKKPATTAPVTDENGETVPVSTESEEKTTSADAQNEPRETEATDDNADSEA